MSQSISQQQSAQFDDKWDGTDIEPSYPRNTVRDHEQTDLDEDYVRQYIEGDRFA